MHENARKIFFSNANFLYIFIPTMVLKWAKINFRFSKPFFFCFHFFIPRRLMCTKILAKQDYFFKKWSLSCLHLQV